MCGAGRFAAPGGSAAQRSSSPSTGPPMMLVTSPPSSSSSSRNVSSASAAPRRPRHRRRHRPAPPRHRARPRRPPARTPASSPCAAPAPPERRPRQPTANARSRTSCRRSGRRWAAIEVVKAGAALAVLAGALRPAVFIGRHEPTFDGEGFFCDLPHGYGVVKNNALARGVEALDVRPPSVGVDRAGTRRALSLANPAAPRCSRQRWSLAPVSSETLTRTRPFAAHAGASAHGRVRVPGDKSISHRALIFGALATGTTRYQGPARSRGRDQHGQGAAGARGADEQGRRRLGRVSGRGVADFASRQGRSISAIPAPARA